LRIFLSARASQITNSPPGLRVAGFSTQFLPPHVHGHSEAVRPLVAELVHMSVTPLVFACAHFVIFATTALGKPAEIKVEAMDLTVPPNRLSAVSVSFLPMLKVFQYSYLPLAPLALLGKA